MSDQVSMSQVDFDRALAAADINGYVRGVRTMITQLGDLARTLEKTCQDIEKPYKEKEGTA